jgi:hypothetical protein
MTLEAPGVSKPSKGEAMDCLTLGGQGTGEKKQ